MFDRPFPVIDSATLVMILVASIGFGAQGLLGFSLYSFLPDYAANSVYLLAGMSSVWQFLRQP